MKNNGLSPALFINQLNLQEDRKKFESQVKSLPGVKEPVSYTLSFLYIYLLIYLIVWRYLAIVVKHVRTCSCVRVLFDMPKNTKHNFTIRVFHSEFRFIKVLWINAPLLSGPACTVYNCTSFLRTVILWPSRTFVGNHGDH